MENINVFDIISQINHKLGRKPLIRDPVPVEILLHCIGEVLIKMNICIEPGLEHILGKLENGTHVCLFGLFGWCEPEDCKYCKTITDVSDDAWKDWCKQSKPKKCSHFNKNSFPIPTSYIPPSVRNEPSHMFGRNCSLHQSTHTFQTKQKTTICKFGYKCTNPNCNFLHPNEINCRYGDQCHNKNCQYQHPFILQMNEKPTPTMHNECVKCTSFEGVSLCNCQPSKLRPSKPNKNKKKKPYHQKKWKGGNKSQNVQKPPVVEKKDN